MSTWLYQLHAKEWPPETFRYEIWEGKPWHWAFGTKRGGKGRNPKVGDTVVFFYARSGGDDPGIYGWAVLDRSEPNENRLYFEPAAPTNYLKMTPWWNKEAERLTDRIRGSVKQGTLWYVNTEDIKKLRAGVRRWLGRA